jgi:hypothetical protein
MSHPAGGGGNNRASSSSSDLQQIILDDPDTPLAKSEMTVGGRKLARRNVRVHAVYAMGRPHGRRDLAAELRPYHSLDSPLSPSSWILDDSRSSSPSLSPTPAPRLMARRDVRVTAAPAASLHDNHCLDSSDLNNNLHDNHTHRSSSNSSNNNNNGGGGGGGGATADRAQSDPSAAVTRNLDPTQRFPLFSTHTWNHWNARNEDSSRSSSRLLNHPQ